MNKRSLVFITITIFVCFIGVSISHASTLFVPDDYESIQAAIDYASAGDTIIIRDGVYTGLGNRDLAFQGKPIVVMSENGPENCIIDCQNQARGVFFRANEDLNTVFEGITITNAYSGQTYYGNGGGIMCKYASPLIRNCRFTHCRAEGNGGAIGLESSHSVISDCYLSFNECPYDGGSIHIFRGFPRITGCTIENSIAGDDGGGISSNYTSPEFTNTKILNNSSQRYGGGINFLSNSSPKLFQCEISDNSALEGGGIYFSSGSLDPAIVSNCLIDNNAATDGGGIMVSRSQVTFSQMTVAGNTSDIGGGFKLFDTHHIKITNSIVYANIPDELHVNSENEPVIEYCLFPGIYPGVGNLHGDPLFYSGPSGEFYLSNRQSGQNQNSPCLNSGHLTSDLECTTLAAGVICMNSLTTRTDHEPDLLKVDMGFHYPSDPIPTPSPTPSPTPNCSETSATLEMPNSEYASGDLCYLSIRMCNTTPETLIGHVLMVALEVNGQFWLAPSWEPASHGLNFYRLDIEPGESNMMIIEPFVWPDIPDSSGETIMFWGGLLTPDLENVVGTFSGWSVSW